MIYIFLKRIIDIGCIYIHFLNMYINRLSEKEGTGVGQLYYT